MGGNCASVGLTTEQTDIYILIGKRWPKKVKKCFFGNFFWTVPFSLRATFIYSLIGYS